MIVVRSLLVAMKYMKYKPVLTQANLLFYNAYVWILTYARWVLCEAVMVCVCVVHRRNNLGGS